MDFVRLETHVGWIKKSLGGLAALCLIGAGWAFANIYQPMQNLVKDSAVQGVVLSGIKDDVSDIKHALEKSNDELKTSPRKR